MKALRLFPVLLFLASLTLWGGRSEATAATAYTFTSVPVSAVSPVNGQVIPASGRAIAVQLNTASPMWPGMRGQFASGGYALRLLNSDTGAVVWFVPKGTPFALGNLTVSNAITYDKTLAIVTAQPGSSILSAGMHYSAILAVGNAAMALAAQDLNLSYSATSPLCCAYGVSGTPPWAFRTAAVTTSAAANATSTSVTGTAATQTISGAITSTGTSTVSASATGAGTVWAATYPSDPVSPPSFPATGAYADISLSLGNTFGTVVLTLGHFGAASFWYNGTSWQRVIAPRTWTNGALQIDLSASSSPNLSQLSGTIFAGALPTVTSLSPATGRTAGGDSVEVIGTGLSGATTVQFGSQVVSGSDISIISDSALQVWKTPAGTGSVPVSVTTPGGTSIPSSAPSPGPSGGTPLPIGPGGGTAAAGPDWFTYRTSGERQQIAVPSYFAPGSGTDWDRLDSAAPTAGMAIINPNSGPGTSCSTAYGTQVVSSQSSGISVLGYVYTRYANTVADSNGSFDRTIANVEADIDRYYACYPTLNGIFFDEGSTDCAYASSYYAILSAYVKSKGGSGTTVINPGQATNECYMSAADIVLTFEGTYNDYLNYTAPSWVGAYPAGRFWHLIYGASDGASMQKAVTLSKQRGAGWVDVTPLQCANGASPPCTSANALNPWYALPSVSYWIDEQAAVGSIAPSVTSVSPSRGPASGGTTVTISGSYLSAVQAVCFGNNCIPAVDTTDHASFTVDSTRDQLTLHAPGGPAGTPTQVTVVSANGSSTPGSAQYTYDGAPAVASVSPSAGSAAGGAQVTVTGSGFTGATSVCFGGSCVTASGFTVVSDTQITAISPRGTAGVTAKVTVTTPSGTTPAGSGDEYTFTGSTNLLSNGDFSGGVSGWTPDCKDFNGAGYAEGSACGSFYSTSSSGIQMTGYQTHPYEGAYQIVPASANAVLTGTVDVSSMDECSDGSIAVSVSPLGAQQQPLAPALNSDPMYGNIVFEHHPYGGCTPYISPSSSTVFYRDMPGWTVSGGSQNFTMNIGALLARKLSGIDPSAVKYVKVQLTDYADTTRPSVTFGGLSLTTGTALNVTSAPYNARGDGVTDDTTAFTTALSDLSAAGGGMLLVPSGTYNVQPQNPSFAGLVVGSGATVAGYGATLSADTSGLQLLGISGANVTLANVTLEGGGNVVRGLSVMGGSSQVDIVGDTVRDITQPADATQPYAIETPIGIRLYGNMRDVDVESSTVSNISAVRPNCTGCTSSVARGILVSPDLAQGESGAQYVTIQHNTVSNVTPRDDGDCVVFQDTTDYAYATVDGNTFTSCAKRAIKIQVPGVVITHNHITNPYNGNNPSTALCNCSIPEDMYSAISIYSYDVQVASNTIDGSGSFFNAVEIGAECGYPSNVTVANNTISMGATPPVAGTSLVRLMGPGADIAITGNSLSNAANGIEVPPGSSALISTNTIANVTTPVQYYASPCT